MVVVWDMDFMMMEKLPPLLLIVLLMHTYTDTYTFIVMLEIRTK